MSASTTVQRLPQARMECSLTTWGLNYFENSSGIEKRFRVLSTFKVAICPKSQDKEDKKNSPINL